MRATRLLRRFGMLLCGEIWSLAVPARLVVFILVVAMSPVSMAAEESTTPESAAKAPSDDLVSLSIEDLLNVEVTSVSKKSERRQDAAAAIYVLTQEDIRRSGATNVPELLRTVPGVSVARLTSSTWSVTARGLGGVFSNKLLVLIDGRSVYTPLFSGVYWDSQDLILEDIDRIEVIRGPGGTLWGANAVNGVINIITKKAVDTQGLLISSGGGTEERGFLASRWGGAVGDSMHYRAHGKLFIRDDGGRPASGDDAHDGWQNVSAGGRMDWDLSPDDKLTIQADALAFGAEEATTLAFLTPPFSRDVRFHSNSQNWNLNSVWTHNFADDSELEISGYYTGYHREDPTFDETRHTIDLDLRHHFQPWTDHDIVWGVAFRHTQAGTEGSEFLSLDPARRNSQTYSAFLQDEITLTDELHLILGTKIEHNGYTGIEVQPNVRLRWSPNDRNTLWAAVSRAVRTPSQAEDDIRIRSATAAGPTEIAFLRYDNSEFESEDLLATELGYRVRATNSLAFDLATFFNHYSHFRSLETGPAFVENGVNVLPIEARNNGTAETYGFELAADWAPQSWWQIRASYSYLHLSYDLPANDPVTGRLGKDTPQNQFSLQNRFDLPHNIEFDTTLRYVDSLGALDVGSYLELDARLAWRPRADLELALVGQNLFDAGHFEFAPTFVNQVPTQVQRGVYAKVTWKFQPGGHK